MKIWVGVLAGTAVCALLTVGWLRYEPRPAPVGSLARDEGLPPVPPVLPPGRRGNIVRMEMERSPPDTPLVRALQKSPVPESRTAHFRTLLTDYRLEGWYLEILELPEGEQGAARVLVSPMITTKGGTSATAIGAIEELYTFDGVTLKLQKSIPGGPIAVFLD